MPKDFTAPSQQWNVQDQINQSKTYQQQQEQNTIKQLQQEQDFNALAEKEKPAWEKLKKYEADGYDMSMHYDKFKTIGAKSGVWERGYNDLRKFTSEGATTLSNLFGQDNSQYLDNIKEVKLREDNWKQNQVYTNPNKYNTKDDVWNIAGGIGGALPYVAGGVAMGASKAPTLGGKLVGDIGRGAVADAYLGSLQHGYKDNFDSQLAQEVGLGVAGQTVGTGIAHLLSKVGSNAKVQPQDTAVKPQQTEVTPTQPTQPVTSQDDIAKKINDNYFGNQTVQPQTTVPDTQYGNKVNDFFNPTKLPPKEDMVTAIKNAIDTDTTDDFISKLPDNINKENIQTSIQILKDAKKRNANPEVKIINEPLDQKFYDTESIMKFADDGRNPDRYNFLHTTGDIKSAAVRYEQGKATANDFKLLDDANNIVSKQETKLINEPTQSTKFQPQEMVLNGETINKTDFDLIQSYQKTREWNRNNPTKKRPISARQHEAYLRNTNIADDVKDMDFNANIAEPQGRMYEPTIDDAVANKVDFETANRMGVIPLSNGSQTLGGGAAGGLESEFNQRDYNNDGTHNYKDTLYGALVGAVGVNAARKLMPNAFKDANIDKNTAGMFVGAKPNDKGAFSDVATRKVMREIDDKSADFTLPQKSKKDVSHYMNMAHNSDADIEDFMYLDGFKGTKDEYIQSKIKQGYDELYDITKEKYTLDEILDHPQLFKQYPELKNTEVSFFEDAKGWNPHGEGSFHRGNIKLKIKDDNSVKSTLLHEIQHAIQSKEGWARGGSIEGSSKYVLENRTKALDSLRQERKSFFNKDGELIKDFDELNKLENVISKLESKSVSHEEARKAYESLWGEQQARATQARMNYTPEQRLSEDWTQTLAKTEGRYNEPIIKYDDGVANSEAKSPQENIFLAKAKARIQAKIDSGEIPERGRTVISPYDNGKQYYIGESGKVYFQTGNKKWRETPNLDTIKDVKYVAENGLTNFKKMINAEDTRFEKALKESQARELEASKTYKMDHKAPTKDSGIRSDNLVDAFSNDIYSKDAARLHGHGATAMDKESVAAIQRVRNKPDAEVTIYRAIPKDINAKINPDDWVTTSKEYAKVHGEGPLKGNYKILEMKVKAKDLYTDGNSIHEWGYSPNKSIDGMTAMSSPTLSGGIVGGFTGLGTDIDRDGEITLKDFFLGAVGGAALTKGALASRKLSPVKKTLEKLNLEKLGNKIKESDFINSMYTARLNSKVAYMKNRDAVFKDINKTLQEAEEMHFALKELSEDTRRNMYRYMTGENVKLEPEQKKLIDNVRSQISGLGKKLVDDGILSEQAFKEWEDVYIHRTYEKHLFKGLKENLSRAFQETKTLQPIYKRGKTVNISSNDVDVVSDAMYAAGYFNKNDAITAKSVEDFVELSKTIPISKGGIQLRKLPNGKYEMRRDWSKSEREKMGEIEDVAFAIPETISRLQELVHHAKFLKEVPEDVIGDTKAFTPEELVANGFIKMNGEKFGALNGKYVQKDVARDIGALSRQLMGKDSQLERLYSEYLTMIKKSHTVYNPAAHINNLTSNMVLQFMEGVNPDQIAKNISGSMGVVKKTQRVKELKAKTMIYGSQAEKDELAALMKDKDVSLWYEAEGKGLFGRSELNDVLMRYANKGEDVNKGLSGLLKSALGKSSQSKIEKIDRFASNLYQHEDNFNRFTLLRHFMNTKTLNKETKAMESMSLDDAIRKVNTVIPDYTKPMAMVPDFLRRSGITPFVAWTYYSTPILLRQLKERPARAMAMMGLMYGAYASNGINPFDEKDMPQDGWAFKRVPLPFGASTDGDKVTTMKIDRSIPHFELFNMLKPADNMFVPQFIKDQLSGGVPQNLAGWMFNYNPYFGTKITYANDSGKKAYHLSKHFVQNIIPTPDVLDNFYNLGESAILSKEARKTQQAVEPRTPTQNILKSLGINLMTYDKSNQRKKTINDEINKLKKGE